MRKRCFVFLLSFLLHASWADTPHNSIALEHGVTVGDVTHNQAVLWARAADEGFVHFEIKGRSVETVLARAADDFTAKALFKNLKPNKKYRYRVWASQTAQSKRPRQVLSGRFVTAPLPDDKVPLSFLWSGDLGGQNACRDLEEGYDIFSVMAKERYQFFVGLGDMIYADGVCEETGLFGNQQLPGNFGVAQTLEDFWHHWRYNFADPKLRRLLSQTVYYSIWDDHEVINDFGPQTATRDGVDLLPVGLKAFLDYNPIAPERETLYQSIRWGGHLEMFFLDTRRYRDHNQAPDSASKSLLGKEQKDWLVDAVANSSATWKVVVSSVPISVPTGFPATNGRDGWSNLDQDTGFENELSQLLKAFQAAQVKNLFWITTDVHFAAVYQYEAFESTDTPLRFYEAMVGPLSAGIYPTDRFDTSFNPSRLFLYAPPASGIKGYEDAKRWMNYGKISISRRGDLALQITNGRGKDVFYRTFEAQ